MRIKAFLLVTIGALIGAQSFGQSHDGTSISGQTLNPNVITTAVPAWVI